MSLQKKLSHHALEWTGNTLKILDQRQLPAVIRFDEYHDAIGVSEAIKTMRVRGAPAIGIAAAFAVVLSAMKHQSKPHWRELVREDCLLLAQSRPTAVNLFWALERMQQNLETANITDLLSLAQQIHADDIAANRKMGEFGADILGDANNLLTHCNAGALATGGYGTALGVIRSAYQRKPRQVYANETRPWLQGARLTVWELQQDSIPSTLIADSAAAYLMQQQKVDWIIVGADRIAANGDVANKIGTYSLAVLAKQHDVKMMVVAPCSTIDGLLDNGQQIAIEQREANELLPSCYQQTDSLVNAWNPVFDITPATLIDAIVTERGVVINPKTTGVKHLL